MARAEAVAKATASAVVQEMAARKVAESETEGTAAV
jgi:hypothetical protein